MMSISLPSTNKRTSEEFENGAGSSKSKVCILMNDSRDYELVDLEQTYAALLSSNQISDLTSKEPTLLSDDDSCHDVEHNRNVTFPAEKKIIKYGLRKFPEQWLKTFAFLRYDKKNNVMFCEICRKFVDDWRKTTPFVAGTNNFRISMIRYHQQSAMHSECQALVDALVAEDSCALEKDFFKDQLSPVFRSVYFIFKNKLPYTSFPRLCESQKQEGTEFPVYSSHIKACTLFGKFICMAFEKELAQKVCNVSEFALVFDGSLKRNIESHDMVYMKYIQGLTVQTVFLGVIDSGAKLHNSMFEILSNLFKLYEIDRWYTKVVYIMTDKSDNHLWMEGLIDMIESLSPKNFVSEVKYLPHKVKFCANVVQSHQSSSTLDALLWSIYCYYEKLDCSRKNLTHINRVLKSITDFYGNLPKNSYTTLYYESLKAIEQDWVGLVSLKEENEVLYEQYRSRLGKSGNRILSVITRSSFIYKMALVLDIFSPLSDFASKLGNEGLLPYDIHILLEEVCSEIESFAKGNGPMTAQIQEELSDCPGFFRGIEIREDSSVLNFLPEMEKFGNDLVCYLKSLIDDTLLEKSFIFNVNLWPEGDELSSFGNSEFEDIFLCFKGSENDLGSVLKEWKSFKEKVSTTFPMEVREDSRSVVAKVVAEAETELPLVIPVLRKILLLNFEVSEITRGYCEMCLNKTHFRSMLSLQSLQTMMMINMHGPSLSEFDFSFALQLFVNSRHRKYRKKIIDNKINFNYLEEEISFSEESLS